MIIKLPTKAIQRDKKICSWWCQKTPVQNICDHKDADKDTYRYQSQDCKWNSYEELHRIYMFMKESSNSSVKIAIINL